MDFTKPIDATAKEIDIKNELPTLGGTSYRSLSSPPQNQPLEIIEEVACDNPTPKRFFENKEEILEIDDGKIIEVEVPEWNGYVYVKALSSFQRDKFEASLQKKTGGFDLSNVRARLVSLCIVDRNGNLLFPNHNDVLSLSKKSGKAVDRIYTEVQKINKMTDEEVEALAKN